jgi:hypothetical protein
MRSHSKPLVVTGPAAGGEPLTVVEVGDGYVVLSTGEEFTVRFEKLRHLCEQLAQEGAPITIRTWWTPAGAELVEVHRA